MSVVVQTDKTVIVHAPSGTVLVGQVLGSSGNTGGGMQASVYDPQEISGDAFDRENHTGTQPMESIGNKQGKVLDDRKPFSNWESARDDLKTPGGYIIAGDGTNGFFSGSLVDVAETGGLFIQAVNSPILGQMSRLFSEEEGWSDFIFPVTALAIMDWYRATTAEAPNAVLNSNGTFSRSVSSDEFKTGIEPMLDEYADAIVQGAQPIYYRSTCEADPDDWSYWGISAEQLAEIDPRLVHWGHSTKEVPQPLGLPPKTVPDLDSPLKPVGVQYSRVVPALLNVVKRQGAALAALEARLAALEAQ